MTTTPPIAAPRTGVQRPLPVGTLIQSDLHRYTGRPGWDGLVASLLRIPGFRYTMVYRLCRGLRGRPALFPLKVLTGVWLSGLGRKYGISIPIMTTIGPGLYIGHYGGIVLNADAVLGRNVNLSHGVTIGQTNRGARQGVPTIGDRVYIGPGAAVIGRLTIGNDAAVGANAVVTKDVPEKGVVVGSPGRVVSSDGSQGYIQNQVDELGRPWGG